MGDRQHHDCTQLSKQRLNASTVNCKCYFSYNKIAVCNASQTQREVERSILFEMPPRCFQIESGAPSELGLKQLARGLVPGMNQHINLANTHCSDCTTLDPGSADWVPLFSIIRGRHESLVIAWFGVDSLNCLKPALVSCSMSRASINSTRHIVPS